MNRPPLTDILDLLVDGPSHLAGLYSSFVRHVRPVSIDLFARSIKELDNRGLVTLWFQNADEALRATPNQRDQALERYLVESSETDLESPYHDEIGLWCEITSSGRDLWRETDNEVGLDGALWTVDEESRDGALTIRAETEYAAERVLDWWLNRHRNRGPIRDVSIKPLSDFQLRDGRSVKGGVELTCRLKGAG